MENNNNVITKKQNEQPYAGDKLLKVKHVMEILGLSRSSLRQLEADKELIPIRSCQRIVRYSETELNNYIENLKIKREQQPFFVNDVEYSADDAYEINSICAEIPGMY